MKEFGEVERIALRQEYPIGYVLRQQEDGIVLEEYFDHKGIKVDVLHQFSADYNLDNEEDLQNCLKVVREYEPDLEVPIYIAISIDPEEERRIEEEKKAYLIRVVQSNMRRPYEWGAKKA